ncbi:protein kinase [Achlya hypogyna]|uniref:Protein kinase n=1 Tax=Achlya hypogyna TaxID=1202772 RepID=A0A1V9YDC7_ACHHY|nr:protein kinase [Achlya hypogyna]
MIVAGAATCGDLKDAYDAANTNCSAAAGNVTYLSPDRWCTIPACQATLSAAAAWIDNGCNVPRDTYPGHYCDRECRAAISTFTYNTLRCSAVNSSLLSPQSSFASCQVCSYLFANLTHLHDACELVPGTYDPATLQSTHLSSLVYCQEMFQLKAVFPFNVTSAAPKAGLSTTNVVAIALCSVGGVSAIGVVVYLCIRRRRRPKPLRGSIPRIATTRASSVDLDLDLAPYVLRTMDRASMTAHSLAMSATDVRFDPRIIRFRIPQSDFEDKKLLVTGGQGQIFHARCHGRAVEFMQEIRISAALRHPHIVQFLGVAWSTLHDIAIVTEYMAGGDVLSILREQAAMPRVEQWLRWRRPSTALTSKLQIAHQVAKALTYMHDLALLHRDIKAKNVVLNAQYVAKLCDFGISRPLVATATMTINKGTLAHMAPEVFTGGHYSEKADIYSFGVLLAELDLMDTPYTGNEDQDPILGDAQIALQVVEGGLRPQFSNDIPNNVRVLADQCLAHNASDRPSASQVEAVLQALVLASC